MKIAVILTIPGDGGTQQAAALTAEALACAGGEVTLLLPDPGDLFVVQNCASVEAAKISPYSPTLGLLRYLKRPLFALKLRKQFKNCVADLKRHLDANRYDILLAVHPTAFMAVRAATSNRIPIAAMLTRIVTSHVRLMRSSDALIVTTKEMKGFAIGKGIQPEHCHVLPHCVIDPGARKSATFHDPVHLGTMARLEANKGIETFVSAVHLLKRRNLKLRATIAGVGKEMGRLTRMCKEFGLQDQLKFSGWLEGDEKEAFFDSIDMLVQPATRDSFGIVLVEGMARGLPVVSGNTVGARHIITHNEDGLIMEAHDPEVLADCIDGLLSNRDKAEQLGRNARATYEQRFTTEVIGTHASKILESVIQQFPRCR